MPKSYFSALRTLTPNSLHHVVTFRHPSSTSSSILSLQSSLSQLETCNYITSHHPTHRTTRCHPSTHTTDMSNSQQPRAMGLDIGISASARRCHHRGLGTIWFWLLRWNFCFLRLPSYLIWPKLATKQLFFSRGELTCRSGVTLSRVNNHSI